MATTGAQAEGGTPQARERSRETKPREGKVRETRLNESTDEPSFVAPGDGPFDTTDPLEQATSVPADKAAAARAGFGVVNAVIPLPENSVVRARTRGVGGGDGEERTETYEVDGPDGKPVRVEHNIDTGETRRA